VTKNYNTTRTFNPYKIFVVTFGKNYGKWHFPNIDNTRTERNILNVISYGRKQMINMLLILPIRTSFIASRSQGCYKGHQGSRVSSYRNTLTGYKTKKWVTSSQLSERAVETLQDTQTQHSKSVALPRIIRCKTNLLIYVMLQ
jgi:hypothetical protein